MPAKKSKILEKIGSFFKKNTQRTVIIIIAVISACFVIFGVWIYSVVFLISPQADTEEVFQKRLSVNSKLYVEVIESTKQNKPQ